MKNKSSLTVTVGTHGYPMTESAIRFEHPDLLGTWYVLEGPDRYVLCEDQGRHLRFIEFAKKPADNWILYKAREWERHPRNDNRYVLTKSIKYHGTRMSTGFSQALKNIHNKSGPV